MFLNAFINNLLAELTNLEYQNIFNIRFLMISLVISLHSLQEPFFTKVNRVQLVIPASSAYISSEKIKNLLIHEIASDHTLLIPVTTLT